MSPRTLSGVNGRVPGHLRAFVAARRDVRAVLQRIGSRTYDLILVDDEGSWTRALFASPELARAAAGALGVAVREGWDDALARLVSARDEWAAPGGHRRAL